ncbi:MAG TPA: MotA/TolQ/ExbB proton channel family protein [Azospirillaceae bacterium]|nr:MotA/TolQ/ExbB proton channel family protein [Azospirillaceae bacterium]
MNDRATTAPRPPRDAAASASPPPQAGAPVALPRPVRARGGLDLATVLGLAGGLALVAAALVMGGNLLAFFDLASVLIVLGGTVAVTAVSFSMEDVGVARRLLAAAVARRVPSPKDTAEYVLRLADVARRAGPLALQGLVPQLEKSGLLRRAVEMIVDGLPAEEVERILRTEIEAEQARAANGARVLRRAAEVAPAMGLIGTLVGLVQMLGSLQDPSSIGPAMAVALLTTFYGAILGSMVLAPLAGKLERNAEAQGLVDTLYMLGAVSVARQENPRRLEILMNTVLPPDLRLRVFD